MPNALTLTEKVTFLHRLCFRKIKINNISYLQPTLVTAPVITHSTGTEGPTALVDLPRPTATVMVPTARTIFIKPQ